MRTVLVVRGFVGLWFAMEVARGPASWARSFDLLADYLLVDGALALLVAVLFIRDSILDVAPREQDLGSLLLIDALGRLVSGAAVHVWPGIRDFPVTAVLFVGIVAVCTAAVGVREATLVVEEEVARHGPRHGRPQLPAWPVAAASLAAIVFGAAAFLSLGDPDRLRVFLAGYILAAAGVMFGMSWSRTLRRQSVRTP